MAGRSVTFRAATATHGIPHSTLTDNGTVFMAHFAQGGKTSRNALENELVRLRVRQENSRPSHPGTRPKPEQATSPSEPSSPRPHQPGQRQPPHQRSAPPHRRRPNLRQNPRHPAHRPPRRLHHPRHHRRAPPPPHPQPHPPLPTPPKMTRDRTPGGSVLADVSRHHIGGGGQSCALIATLPLARMTRSSSAVCPFGDREGVPDVGPRHPEMVKVNSVAAATPSDAWTGGNA